MTSTTTRTSSALLLILCAAIYLPARRAGGTTPEGFQLIANPANPTTSVDVSFVRDAYLKRQAVWDNGETIRPIDLTSRFPARETFTHDVLQKTLAQLRVYWNQQIFSGKGVPPPEVDSEAAMIAYVMARRGAIGYLPANASLGGTKLLSLH